ncbi:MAG TPA: aspartate/glutamate racemase family protein [Ktedonobacterales bacterium]|nr:aspartate/glutamate racemase family protein [Ktedonobacterales bacterium]
MKTIGLIGGLSWESSSEYYRIINETVARRLGGLHSAQSIMFSFDFAAIEALQYQGRWDDATIVMIEAAQQIERGGADVAIICSNTMHKMADAVQEHIDIPLIHIADPTGEAIVAQGLRRVGLLATKFTMEQDFYRGRLAERFGLDVITPDADKRQIVHAVIYDELCRGTVREESKARYVGIIHNLIARGAEGIFLGCTEIEMLIGPADSPVPVFDTTALHAEAAVAFALAT